MSERDTLSTAFALIAGADPALWSLVALSLAVRPATPHRRRDRVPAPRPYRRAKPAADFFQAPKSPEAAAFVRGELPL